MSLHLIGDGYEAEKNVDSRGRQKGWVVSHSDGGPNSEAPTKGEAFAKAIEAKAARDEAAAARAQAAQKPLLLPPPRPAASLSQNPYAGMVPDADGNLVSRDKIVGGVDSLTVLAKLVSECEG